MRMLNRINESDIHRIVRNSIKNYINEGVDRDELVKRLVPVFIESLKDGDYWLDWNDDDVTDRKVKADGYISARNFDKIAKSLGFSNIDELDNVLGFDVEDAYVYVSGEMNYEYHEGEERTYWNPGESEYFEPTDSRVEYACFIDADENVKIPINDENLIDIVSKIFDDEISEIDYSESLEDNLPGGYYDED